MDVTEQNLCPSPGDAAFRKRVVGAAFADDPDGNTPSVSPPAISSSSRRVTLMAQNDLYYGKLFPVTGSCFCSGVEADSPVAQSQVSDETQVCDISDDLGKCQAFI